MHMPNLRAAAPIVCCPGCGHYATLEGDESIVVRCPCCTTPLMTYQRRFDVEHAVRERLYGNPHPSVEATVPRRTG